MRLLGSHHETDNGYNPEARVELAHGQVEIDSDTPPVKYTVAVPTDQEAGALGLIIPGLGAFKQTSRLLRNHLADNEAMATISYDPLRAQAKKNDTLRDLANPQELHFKTVSRILSDVAINPAVAKLKTIGNAADMPITLLPHSMGGIPAAEYAITFPDTVDEIVYLGCVGMQDAQGSRLIARGVKEIGYDILPKIVSGKFSYDARLAIKSFKYFATNAPRTIAEIASCTTADIRPQVLELARLGVSQSIVCFENDIFFPPEETLDGIGDFIGHEHIYIMPGAEHVDPQVNAAGTAAFIGQVLARTRPTFTSAAVA